VTIGINLKSLIGEKQSSALWENSREGEEKAWYKAIGFLGREGGKRNKTETKLDWSHRMESILVN